MDIYEVIKKRRSIRQYKNKEIPKEVLDRILEAATWAPSGKNLQNWRFYVLAGPEKDKCLVLTQKAWLHIKDVLEKRLKPSLYKFTERFFFTLGGAPIVIFAYSKPDPNENNQTSLGSVYMAVQNLMLAAQAEGLGTCSMGSFLEIKDDVNELVNPEKDYQLVCGVVLGYPDHEPPAPPRQPDRITFRGF
jgi:nitroreductase